MNNITALITPFLEDKKIDYITLKKLIWFQENSSIDSLLLLGTTSETFSLTLKEKLAICNIAFDIFTKTKIIAIEGNNINKILNEIDIFKTFNPDYFLITSPYFVKGDNDGLYNYFINIASYSHIPIFIYNIPSRAGFNIDIDVLKKLSSHLNIKGIKNASFDHLYNLKLSLLNSEDFKVYSGNDLSYIDNLCLNHNGCFSVISNVIPNYFNDIFSIYAKDKIYATSLFKKILPTLLDMEKYVNPTSIKMIMHSLNIIKYVLRSPFSSTYLKDKITYERSIFDEYFTCG